MAELTCTRAPPVIVRWQKGKEKMFQNQEEGYIGKKEDVPEEDEETKTYGMGIN